MVYPRSRCRCCLLSAHILNGDTPLCCLQLGTVSRFSQARAPHCGPCTLHKLDGVCLSFGMKQLVGRLNVPFFLAFWAPFGPFVGLQECSRTPREPSKSCRGPNRPRWSATVVHRNFESNEPPFHPHFAISAQLSPKQPLLTPICMHLHPWPQRRPFRAQKCESRLWPPSVFFWARVYCAFFQGAVALTTASLIQFFVFPFFLLFLAIVGQKVPGLHGDKR